MKGALFALLLLSLPTGETVEVTLKSSKTVKGELLHENLKGITVAGSEQIPWTSVEKVNGKSVRERVAEIRQSQKNILCPDCKGGLVSLLCPECQGLGKAYAETKPCERCGGAGGSTPCTAKTCDKGKVDCPGSCLKRTVGVWKEHGSLGLCRVFIFRSEKGDYEGMSGISLHHLGETIEYKEGAPIPLPDCPKCGGTKSACAKCREAGTFVINFKKNGGPCGICGGPQRGQGRVLCLTCLGKGTLPCSVCLGTKSMPIPESAAPCTLCKGGIVPCALCESTGLNTPGRNPKVATLILQLRGELRAALDRFDEAQLPVTDRITFRDGRAFAGTIVHRTNTGVFLGLRAAGTQDLQILPVLVKYGFLLTPSSAAPSASTPPPSDEKKAPPVAPPAASPDTVVLRDGTTVSGKIVAKSEELVMVQTADGKFVKIEAAKIAEIRSAPKTPK